ncbi:hypothetical protein CXB51_035706 [Gossypium anomalum]|uniref:Uncharacterized protein n=1 Tax=Gossypium anomalum TaxID=47600 RepID=A0A8J5YI00_9ROSI|nr:hypothetical protein CXB51_035706 [Gossypium anomalum]
MRKTKLGVCRLVYVILGAVSGHGTECNVNRWLPAPTKVMGLVVTTISTWNHGPSYVGLPEELEDFRLLLDQSSEANFEWMSFADANIIYCIPSEVFANWDMWDVNVSLLVYVMVEIHKLDQVLR